MKIYVDADGSPVKDEVIALGEKYQLEVVMVTAIEHYSNKIFPQHVSFVYVDQGPDAVDFKIVSLIQKNDLLVTQDYGLASLVIDKAYAINQTGMIYTKDNIDQLLWKRHLSQQMRRQGLRTKKTGKFLHEHHLNFYRSADNLIKEILEKQ